jgi:hypothetical protein
MQTRTTAFRHLDAQTFLGAFFPRRKETLELSNSVVCDINHAHTKYGCSVTKSKLAWHYQRVGHNAFYSVKRR